MVKLANIVTNPQGRANSNDDTNKKRKNADEEKVLQKKEKNLCIKEQCLEERERNLASYLKFNEDNLKFNEASY